jgi:hypothetical protein
MLFPCQGYQSLGFAEVVVAGRSWPSYYWQFSKALGKECYGTWRQELTASIVTVLFYYAIDRSDFDLRRGLQATAFTLAAFVCWHLVRVPWLIYKSEHSESPHWKFGLLGLLFGVFTAWLIVYTGLWFYTMQPVVKLEGPAPSAREVRIAQLELKIKQLEPFQEPKDSLRRRTIKLVNDLSLFWIQKPSPQMPVQNPATDEDRKRNAVWDLYWRETQAAYTSRDFSDRVLGIVREYKTKGVPTGFLSKRRNNRIA